MKSIYKVILSIWISILSHSVFALEAPAALVPAGLNPGDQFYIMFATSISTPGNLSVAQFNAFVNQAADLSSVKGTDDPGITWKAWLAHDDGTVQTVFPFAADATQPIYNTNGDLLASNRADLLDGTLTTAILTDEEGADAGGNEVYSGADEVGVASTLGDDTLGGADANSDGCTIGDRTASGSGSFSTGLGGGAGCGASLRMYAISPLLTVPGLVNAPAALVPAGLNPGEQFYVMFRSTGTIGGDQAVVDYNNLVNTDAGANNVGPAIGLTWSALMNHEDALGATTEQTLSLFAANEVAPVYTTAGEQISANRAGLFDGAIDTAISYKADGQLGLNNTVWTGSDAAGAALFPLGDSAASANATEGLSYVVDNKWIKNTPPHIKSYFNSNIYAVSPLLVVPVIAPTAVNDAATVTVNSSVIIDVLANDSDADGNLEASTVALQSAPANGAAVVNLTNGFITYSPNANYIGSDSFTYLVKDNNNANSNVATVSITIAANTAPTAGNDVATVTANSSVNIDVLANDSDADGNLVASTVALQSQPANGAAVVNSANGVITYTPNANYIGSDSFTYLVKDNNNANSNIATVSITVNAATPVASGSSGGGMDWSLLMFFLALSLLRVKARK